MICTTVFLNLIHPKVKVLTGVFLLAISVAAHIREMPFRNRRLDFFEEITLISQFLTFYLGMFFTSDSTYRIDGTTSTILAYFIVIVNVGVLAYLFAMLILYTSKLKICIKLRNKCCFKPCLPATAAGKQQNATAEHSAMSLKDRLRMAGHIVAKQNSNSLMRIVFNRNAKNTGMNSIFKLFGAQSFDDGIPPPAVPKCQFCARQDPRHSYVVCSLCGTAMYCGKACLMEAWRETHKDECRGVKNRANDTMDESTSKTQKGQRDMFSFGKPKISKSQTSEAEETRGHKEEGDERPGPGSEKADEVRRLATKREKLEARREMASTKVLPQDTLGWT